MSAIIYFAFVALAIYLVLAAEDRFSEWPDNIVSRIRAELDDRYWASKAD